MILTFFEKLVMGHLIGDYILQNNWMAQRKGAHYFPCIVHCLIYTTVVTATTTLNPWWALVVFLSHFPIDKYSLADKWLEAYGGRSLQRYLARGHLDVPNMMITDNMSEPIPMRDNYIRLRAGFTTFVYIMVDNTMHMMLMLLGAYYLSKFGIISP